MTCRAHSVPDPEVLSDDLVQSQLASMIKEFRNADDNPPPATLIYKPWAAFPPSSSCFYAYSDVALQLPLDAK